MPLQKMAEFTDRRLIRNGIQRHAGKPTHRHVIQTILHTRIGRKKMRNIGNRIRMLKRKIDTGIGILHYKKLGMVCGFYNRMFTYS